MAEAVLDPKNPMIGNFGGCWARARPADIAVALANRLMNCRRFMPTAGFGTS